MSLIAPAHSHLAVWSYFLSSFGQRAQIRNPTWMRVTHNVKAILNLVLWNIFLVAACVVFKFPYPTYAIIVAAWFHLRAFA